MPSNVYPTALRSVALNKTNSGFAAVNTYNIRTAQRNQLPGQYQAIRPTGVPTGEKPTTPVTAAQRTALRSVVGSLAWVASYTTRSRIPCECAATATKATIETLRDSSRVAALALNDADRTLVYKARLPWGTGELAIVRLRRVICRGEAGHKSQRGCIHYLMSHMDAINENSNIHDMHLVSFSSSTMKHVCRATLQCEAYSWQHALEHGDRLRASVLRKLPVRSQWEEIAGAKYPACSVQ